MYLNASRTALGPPFALRIAALCFAPCPFVRHSWSLITCAATCRRKQESSHLPLSCRGPSPTVSRGPSLTRPAPAPGRPHAASSPPPAQCQHSASPPPAALQRPNSATHGPSSPGRLRSPSGGARGAGGQGQFEKPPPLPLWQLNRPKEGIPRVPAPLPGMRASIPKQVRLAAGSYWHTLDRAPTACLCCCGRVASGPAGTLQFRRHWRYCLVVGPPTCET